MRRRMRRVKISAIASVVFTIAGFATIGGIPGCTRSYHQAKVIEWTDEPRTLLRVGIPGYFVGKPSAFKFSIFISRNIQVVGLDIIELLHRSRLRPQEYTNSRYCRFGHRRYKGKKIGSLTVEQNTGINWSAYDVTKFVKENPSESYFIAVESRLLMPVHAYFEIVYPDGRIIRGKRFWYNYLTDEISGSGTLEIEVEAPRLPNRRPHLDKLPDRTFPTSGNFVGLFF